VLLSYSQQKHNKKNTNEQFEFIRQAFLETQLTSITLVEFILINILASFLGAWIHFSCYNGQMTYCPWKYHNHFLYTKWWCFHFIFSNNSNLIQQTVLYIPCIYSSKSYKIVGNPWPNWRFYPITETIF
jgi:hypothetical protein